MTREAGYSKIACDRCGKSAFLQPNSAAAQSWYDVSHLTAAVSTSSQAPSVFTLCADCYRDFQTFAADADATFNKWLSNKTQEDA